MSKRNQGSHKLKLLLLGATFCVFGSIALFAPHQSTSANYARIDPSVDEMIKQARGLQKLGRWDAAADILTKLASEGEPVALYHLGRAYKNGWGVEPDLDQARLLFMEAAKYTFAYRGETAYELGRLFQRSSGEKCAEIAFQWFHKALDWDYHKAHVQLAKHYERGIGTERDLATAFRHYENAAIAGYPSSTINYARILETGRYGLTPDREQAQFLADRAIEGLEKKARDGSASSAKTLGRLYRDGSFVPQDRKMATNWFVRSASLGDAGAMHDLGTMLLEDPQDDIATAEGLKWLRLAADSKHGGALTALARLHLRKRFDLKPEDALGMLREAVEGGHPGAMEELGRLYAEGILVSKDTEKAIELAKKGADRGHQGSSKLLKKLEAPVEDQLTKSENQPAKPQTKKEG